MMGCMVQAAILTSVCFSAVNAMNRGKMLPELIAVYLAFQAIALFLQMSPHQSWSACAKAAQYRCDTARKRRDVTSALAWALVALGWPLLCHARDEASDPLLVQAKYAQIHHSEREGKLAANILSTVAGVITAILHITTTERHCLATFVILLNVRLAQQAYTLASDDAGNFMMQQSLNVTMGYVVASILRSWLALDHTQGGLICNTVSAKSDTDADSATKGGDTSVPAVAAPSPQNVKRPLANTKAEGVPFGAL